MNTKKTLLALVLGAFAISTMHAGNEIDIKGNIMTIDPANHTLMVMSKRGNMPIFVAPYTKIKGDDCGIFGQDTRMSFAQIRQGMYAKIEAIPNGNALLAKEIEVDCKRQMTY